MNATPTSLPVIVAGGGIGGLAVIGADGVKSAVRRQYVGGDARVSGHVVYRAVVDEKDFPPNL